MARRPAGLPCDANSVLPAWLPVRVSTWPRLGKHLSGAASRAFSVLAVAVTFISPVAYAEAAHSPNTLFLGRAISSVYGSIIMELRHLRYFVAVAEELNVTHA